MNIKRYPFIDIAVLEPVREKCARGDAILIFDPELKTVVWANGPGAKLFGYDDIEAISMASDVLSIQVKRQIASTRTNELDGQEHSVMVRLASGFKSNIVSLQVAMIALPQSEPAIMMSHSFQYPRAIAEQEQAIAAVSGFGDEGYHAALINDAGCAIAASPGFDDLQINTATLQGLVEEMRDDSDRLIKRPIDAGDRMIPAGFAHLSDDPVIHFLVVIDQAVDETQIIDEVADGVEGSVTQSELTLDSSQTNINVDDTEVEGSDASNLTTGGIVAAAGAVVAGITGVVSSQDNELNTANGDQNNTDDESAQSVEPASVHQENDVHEIENAALDSLESAKDTQISQVNVQGDVLQDSNDVQAKQTQDSVAQVSNNIDGETTSNELQTQPEPTSLHEQIITQATDAQENVTQTSDDLDVSIVKAHEDDVSIEENLQTPQPLSVKSVNETLLDQAHDVVERSVRDGLDEPVGDEAGADIAKAALEQDIEQSKDADMVQSIGDEEHKNEEELQNTIAETAQVLDDDNDSEATPAPVSKAWGLAVPGVVASILGLKAAQKHNETDQPLAESSHEVNLSDDSASTIEEVVSHKSSEEEVLTQSAEKLQEAVAQDADDSAHDVSDTALSVEAGVDAIREDANVIEQHTVQVVEHIETAQVVEQTQNMVPAETNQDIELDPVSTNVSDDDSEQDSATSSGVLGAIAAAGVGVVATSMTGVTQDEGGVDLSIDEQNEAQDHALEPQGTPSISHDSEQIETPKVVELTSDPIRFVWHSDKEGRFSSVSSEFISAVGPRGADIVGKTFSQVSHQFNIDPDGEVSELMERQDTWSGRSVLWPIEGEALCVPVDLAALPVFDRARNFQGFNGFGVARMADVMVDSDEIGLKLMAPLQETIDENAQIVSDSALSHEHDETREEDVEHAQTSDVAHDEGSNSESLAGNSEPNSTLETLPVEAPALLTIPKVDLVQDEIGQNEQAIDANATVHLDEASQIEDISIADGAQEQVDEKLAVDTDLPSEEVVKDDDLPEPQAVEEQHTDEQSQLSEDDDSKMNTLAQFSGYDKSLTASDRNALAAIRNQFKAQGLVPDVANPDLTEKSENALDDVKQATPPPIRSTGFLPSAFQTSLIHPSVENKLIDAQSPNGNGVYRSVLEFIPLPTLVTSEGKIVYANNPFLELSGYDTLQELEAAGGLDVLFADPVDTHYEQHTTKHKIGLQTKSGNIVGVHAHMQSVTWSGDKALLFAFKTSASDSLPSIDEGGDDDTVSESRDLEKRTTQLATILDTATDGVVLIGNDKVIRSLNGSAEKLFGLTSGEMEGQDFSQLFAVESQRIARDYLEGLALNGAGDLADDGREVIGREAHGRFIPLFMTIGRLPADGGYCAVLRDITNWKRTADELSEARRQAEVASTQKTKFLARVSHEIRTPLNAIIGFSELMLTERFGPVGNRRYKDYLNDINRSGNHVLDLVNDLLDISKIEAGQQEMKFEGVSINETLDDVLAIMQPQANRERVIIRSSFASGLPDVVADLRAVKQIALNILSNAVKYTQPGGQVIVSTAYEKTGSVVLRVRDTGIGMTKDEVELALMPFRQVSALHNARGGGTGLGLPLTKAMVEANRATFMITSQSGEGTIVEVVFPPARVLANH